MKGITEEEAKLMVENKNYIYDHIEIVDKETRLFYYCPIHKDRGLLSSTIYNFKNYKCSCCYCSHRKQTTEDIKKRLHLIHPNIEILDEYKNVATPIRCLCNIDGTIWYSNVNRLISAKSGCPTCGKNLNSLNRTKKLDKFKREIYEKYGNTIKLISPYKGAREKVTCNCTLHNFDFEITASRLVNNCTTPCPICRSENTSKRCVMTNEEFLKRLKEINPNIIPLEKYINNGMKIKCKCSTHDYIWYVTPNKLLTRRTGCPKCCSYNNENIICSLLDKWGYNYVLQHKYNDCRDKYPLPFDIYLPDFNLNIEYDGEQHYYPIPRGTKSKEEAQRVYEITCKHDQIKTRYCKNNNIGLIRIPYWEKDNIEYFLFDEMVKNKAIIINEQ